MDLLSGIEFDGLCLGVMKYGFDDNFYMHLLDYNKACISVSDVDSILLEKDISLENFIIKNTYNIFLLHKYLETFDSADAYKLIHNDTRGCLFDMNGDKRDVVFSVEQTKICDECKSKIKKKAVPEAFISNIEKELCNIKKPFIKTVELFIKKNPLFSILSTFIFSFVINIFSSWIWDIFF